MPKRIFRRWRKSSTPFTDRELCSTDRGLCQTTVKMKRSPKMLYHPIPPLYDEFSRVLILGSFPSVKSREQQFFYGHKQNRFWRVMAQVLDCPVPVSIEQKREMLLSHHIAVWDVIAGCEITGSSEASIRNSDLRGYSGNLYQRRQGRTAVQKIYLSGERTGSGYAAIYKPGKRGVFAGKAGGGLAGSPHGFMMGGGKMPLILCIAEAPCKG